MIAHATGANFPALSAVSAGVADLRRVVADARNSNARADARVLFIDEIHRFNKAQQDAVLPYVEDGTVTLIGATTENPSFEVNSALLSRSRVFVLKALDDDDIRTLIERALHDAERGLGTKHVDDDAGRARRARESRQRRRARRRSARSSSPPPPRRSDADGRQRSTCKTIADALQRRARLRQIRRRALRHDQRVHQDRSAAAIRMPRSIISRA